MGLLKKTECADASGKYSELTGLPYFFRIFCEMETITGGCYQAKDSSVIVHLTLISAVLHHSKNDWLYPGCLMCGIKQAWQYQIRPGALRLGSWEWRKCSGVIE